MNTDDDADDYRDKLAEHGVTWMNAWNGKELCQKFGVNSFPTIVILDQNGRVQVANVRGEGIAPAVQTLLDKLKLEERAGTR